MTIRHCTGQILRTMFPNKMELFELFDYKRKCRNRMKRIQPNVHFTRDQWIEAIKEQYKDRTGHELDLKSPKRYTEKIQWRKLYDHNPLYSVLSDKYAVRKWIKEKIGEEYLIPLLGVWSRAKDIDFNLLPDSFVLKTNNASATNILVKNKTDINRKLINAQLNHWLAYPFWAKYGEFHYKDIPPVIIAEKYMQCEETEDLLDYKFLCFNGKPYCCMVIDRHHGHKQIIYDMDWKPQVWRFSAFEEFTGSIEKPPHFDKMLSLVQTLCEGFSHVRVDLYLIQQQIYFGEMTFTSGSGYITILPDEYDYILGEQWTIN